MLLAKSVREGIDPKTLPAHTKDVLRAADALFVDRGELSRLGRAWVRFFGISAQPIERFVRHLRIAAAFHDLGKANDGFQDAVQQGGPQVVRHEHLSGMLMAERGVEAWLRASGLDVGVLISAVLSHHLKVSHKGPQALGGLLPGGRSLVRILSDHPDFGTVWNLIQDEVGSACPTPIQFPTRWSANEIKQRADAVKTMLQREKSLLRDDVDRRRLLGAVRSALIVADSVGSAVTRLPDAIAPWVRDSFPAFLSGDDIQSNVIGPRINQLRNAGRWDEQKGFSDFQREIAGQGPRVLLTTPCGSGKTLAAWNWIKAQLASNSASRAVFLYPTRATATEGFRDYVSWAPESDAALMSGTADYDLQGMFDNPDDVRHGRKYQADPRLFALGQWRKRIFSATADQFFPFLQYAYGPVCLLPLLAESVLVVDEVHSFDRSMFASLKRFLKEFSVPVLCMTATLPNKRREDLVECGLRPYPETTPQDLAQVAEHPRYQIEWVDRDRVKAFAHDALAENCRVLWVVNRVRDCQSAFSEQRDVAPDAPVFCYHSRYRLMDRRDRHNELVRGFQNAARVATSPNPIMGVTTQVCEMSLDIDADVLITEVAPISSLIQRMGRCNRKWPILDGRIGRVYVVRREEGTEKPYEKKDLDAATRFIDYPVGREVSQLDLETAYERFDPQEVEPDKHCPFLDSGPYAESGEESFRETDDFTVPCVLCDDLPAVLQALRERKPYDGFIVPVPKRFADESKRPPDSCFPRWLSVAPSSRYHSSSGFSDQP